MARMVVLLRGINLGSSNRIAMSALREGLAGAGFENARTYVQSGNIIVNTELGEAELTEAVEKLIAQRFSLTIPAVTRGAEELARVVAGNPFPELAAQEPKRFQVTFLRGAAERGLEARLSAVAAPGERVAVRDREIYAWHPDGVARSKLWAKLGARTGLGADATPTSRNWTTVLTLLEMALSDAG